MRKTVVLYLPALHQAYIQFLKEYTLPGDRLILINGKSFAIKYPAVNHLERDLRAISPLGMITVLEAVFESYNLFGSIAGKRTIELVSDIESLTKMIGDTDEVVMPDEEVSQMIVSLIPGIDTKTKLVPAKLRWDKSKAFLQTEITTEVISHKVIPEHVYQQMLNQAGKSVDWWRRVACVVYRDDVILCSAYNKHLPTDGVLNIMGDPRSNFSAGEHIEYCSAIHAEALLIARAAREGSSLRGASLLVSDFPCPNCAKLIAQTGIKNVFFVQGYSQADGKDVLESAGVVIKQIVFNENSGNDVTVTSVHN